MSDVTAGDTTQHDSIREYYGSIIQSKEDRAAAGVEDDSVDVVISSCVINLSPNKHKAFSEIFRVRWGIVLFEHLRGS